MFPAKKPVSSFFQLIFGRNKKNPIASCHNMLEMMVNDHLLFVQSAALCHFSLFLASLAPNMSKKWTLPTLILCDWNSIGRLRFLVERTVHCESMKLVSARSLNYFFFAIRALWLKIVKSETTHPDVFGLLLLLLLRCFCFGFCFRCLPVSTNLVFYCFFFCM